MGTGGASQQILSLFLSLLCLPACVDSYAYDITLPKHKPSCQCENWSNGANMSAITALWGSKAALLAAGSSCAMPANGVSPDPDAEEYATYDGWCLCQGQKPQNSNLSYAYGYCQSPVSFPSQINLLALNASAVVVNFVTGDDSAIGGGARAIAEYRQVGSNKTSNHSTGHVSDIYTTYGSSRHRSYHNVVLSGLQVSHNP